MKTDNSTERIAGLLGMARRAGRLTAGFDAVSLLIANGKAAVVILAADLSEKTEKELRYAAKSSCDEEQMNMLRIPLNKEEIGHALGLKKPAGVLALEDEGFAASIQKLCRHDFEEECSL